MLDGSCHIWQFPCSSSGACELYDLWLFRVSFHGLSLALKCASFIFLLCLLVRTWKWEDWQFSKKADVTINTSDVKYTKVSNGNAKDTRYKYFWKFPFFVICYNEAKLVFVQLLDFSILSLIFAGCRRIKRKNEKEVRRSETVFLFICWGIITTAIHM
jgi:hypothetical protein